MPGIKFDKTLTIGTVLMILTFLLGGIGLYVQSSNRDVRQDADIDTLRGQVAAMILYGQRLTAVEVKLEGVGEDIAWIRRWLERTVPAQ